MTQNGIQNGARIALSIPQMARELGISKTTAYALTKQSNFPTFRVAKRTLVPVDALMRWIENGGTAENVTPRR